MSVRNNLAGKQLVVDSILTLGDNNSSPNETKRRLYQALSSIELNKVKKELIEITDDGTITPQEKLVIKREWGNIKSSYTNIFNLLEFDYELKEYKYYTQLKERFALLSQIMERVLFTMNVSYNAEDVKYIDDYIVECWEYINKCSNVYDKRNNLTSSYSIKVDGELEINTATNLTAAPYCIDTNEDVLAYNPYDISWYRMADGVLIKSSSDFCTITSDDLKKETSQKFFCRWKCNQLFEEGTFLEGVNIYINYFFTVKIKEIKQYQWNEIVDESDLSKLDKDWFAEKPEGVTYKYLWVRTSSDNGKTWVYFRATGEEGKSYTINILTSDGNIYKYNQPFSCILSAQVLENNNDITNTLEDYRFNWKRKTTDIFADEQWNTSSKALYHKQITITNEDCIGRTVFDCEVEL